MLFRNIEEAIMCLSGKDVFAFFDLEKHCLKELAIPPDTMSILEKMELAHEGQLKSDVPSAVNKLVATGKITIPLRPT